jgi:molecular chaperone GrpE
MNDPREPGLRAVADAGTQDPEATTVLGEDGVRPDAEAVSEALAEARAKAEENFNQYVRVLAEFDNYRKRAARDFENAQRYAVERFAQELLGVLDGFELARANAAGADARSLLEGQEATYRLLLKAFEKAGVAEIEATGKTFDPERHEAMVAQPSAAAAPGTVLETVQKGYLLNGRLLRPARVVVARGP